MLQKIVIRDPSKSQWLEFLDPQEVLLARSPTEVLPVLREAERRANCERLHVAGFVTYEAASGFDAALPTHSDAQLPLVCLGLFRQPRVSSQLDRQDCSESESAVWNMTESRSDYVKKISLIKQQIELGNTYQINYTTRKETTGIDDAWALFVRVAADAPYAAYVECDDKTIVSASPELFFRLRQDRLTCKPMKGTAERGVTFAEDIALRDELQISVKNRAENVMILDMVRNDVGRIAKHGSVVATDVFALEKFPTVWQMTSTVAADTDASISDIFEALFPSASVTGAPKVSSMRIIHELEETPRSIYTGAIGYFSPDRQAQFNVAIRSALIDKSKKRARYGVGGGVVWDSDADDEYDECLAKARILDRPRPSDDFDLLETMLWTPDQGYFLLQQHLDRLYASAEYFDFALNRTSIEAALAEIAEQFSDESRRVRLLLRRDGIQHISHSSLADNPGPDSQSVVLSKDPIDTRDVFFYHKTTRRTAYDNALDSIGPGDDVLLWNADGYITETSIANVAVRIDGHLYTPPVACGLLAGTYRQWLLEKNLLRERRIHIDELGDGAELLLFNSVRRQYSGSLQKVPTSMAGK